MQGNRSVEVVNALLDDNATVTIVVRAGALGLNPRIPGEFLVCQSGGGRNVDVTATTESETFCHLGRDKRNRVYCGRIIDPIQVALVAVACPPTDQARRGYPTSSLGHRNSRVRDKHQGHKTSEGNLDCHISLLDYEQAAPKKPAVCD